MEIGRIIEEAKAQGRKTLTEAEAKSVLKCYGIPVVKETVAASPKEAALQAETFGFPVVLKGLGAKLTHKTERGLVHLKLHNKREVLTAAKAIARGAGKDLEGYLVQPYVAGRREFVAGLLFDPHFGPMVMLGLGGVFTEALKDVVFRIAPVDEAEAGRMMDELRSSRLFAPFRGEAGVCRDQIVASLVGLSHLAEECPDVVEVDINPLVVGADGRVTAVDALICLGERPAETTARPPVDVKDIARIFSPRSIAFVGASAQLGKWGNLLLTNCLAGGFEGKVYLVNPKGGEIAGRPVYKTLTDIPDPVDLVVVTIPASQVLALLPACQAKGVRYMLLVTSGFCETGEEGAILERQLIQAAREAGVLLVGPNTMGICNPHEHFHCVATPYWPTAGSIGLVSQSGNLGTQLLAFAEQEGIGIRSFCGSGNESMITVEDYLNGLGQDEVTKTVLLYIESIKDGRRFYRTVRETSRRKPVIVLKGGRTEAGCRAASSHTGAMASEIGRAHV
jgi:acyl-CoA synthetase (NDP forming)